MTPPKERRSAKVPKGWRLLRVGECVRITDRFFDAPFESIESINNRDVESHCREGVEDWEVFEDGSGYIRKRRRQRPTRGSK